MNELISFDTAWCVRLIETLIHFLWQGAVIALLTLVAAIALRRASANARYVLYVAALMLMAACLPATFTVLDGSATTLGDLHLAEQQAAIAGTVRTQPAGPTDRAATAVSHSPARRLAAGPEQPNTTEAQPSQPVVSGGSRIDWQGYAPQIAACYLVGVLLMVGRLLLGLHGSRRLRRLSQPVDDPAVLAALARQARLIGLACTPAIAYCRQVAVPTVVGVLRPMVLLPFSLASGLSPEQVEVLLAHELAHIRRYDHLVNLLQRVLEAALFFHPAVWYVSRRIRIERENCCDDLVLAAGGQAVTYAASLVEVAELCGTSCRRARLAAAAALGAADRQSQLRSRILRLIEGPTSQRVRLTRGWAVLLALVAALAIIVAVQPAASETNDEPTDETAEVAEAPETGQPAPIEFNLRLEKFPVEQADFYCIQGIGPVQAAPESADFCLSERAKLIHRPEGTLGFALLFDESGGTGSGYDTLYVDFNNDGNFLDDPAYTASTFEGDKTPDGLSARAYFENVRIARLTRPGTETRVQIFLGDREGELYNCSVIPQNWAVGTLTVGDKTMPAGLIDRDWNGSFTDFGVFDPEKGQLGGGSPKGDYLVLGINGEEAIMPPTDQFSFGRGGTARAILNQFLALDSGTYEFTAEQDADGISVRLEPSELEGGSVVLPASPEGNRMIMVGTDTAVLLTQPGQQIEVPADTYYAPHYGRKTLEVEPGQTATFEVLYATGTVVDADTGEPIPSFTATPGIVIGKWFWSRVYWHRRRSETFTDGSYTILLDSDWGKCRILIEADGYEPQESANFEIADGEQVLNFALRPADPITGIVRSPDGRPAAGATVALTGSGTYLYVRNGVLQNIENCIHAKTDADGWFSLPPQTGSFTVLAVHDDGYAELASQTFTSTSEVNLQRWGRIDGQLRIGDKPGRHKPITLQYDKAPFLDKTPVVFRYGITTDSDGRFLVDRATAGAAHVGRSIRHGVSHNELINVEPGQTVKVTIGGTGRPVVGQIVIPYSFNFEFDWDSAVAGAGLKRLEPDWPKKQSEEKQAEWLMKWWNSKEGKEYRRSGKHYVAEDLKAAGRLRIEDVPAAEYLFSFWVPGKQTQQEQSSSLRSGRLNGVIEKHEFKVPKMPGGRSDKPLDLGKLEITIDSRLKTEQPVAPFDLEGLHGRRARLGDYRGQLVLLHFWKSDCEHCAKEVAHLKEVYKTFAGDDRVAMIGLSLDKQPRDARDFVTRHGLDWVQGLAGEWSESTIAKQYDVQAIPAVFLIGPNGKLMSGMLRGEQIKEELTKALERMEGAAAANRPHDKQTDSDAAAPAKTEPTTQPAEN